MTKENWETGRIKLPSAEFAKLRRRIQEEDAAIKSAAFAHTQMFWDQLTPEQQSDPVAYQSALGEYCRRQVDNEPVAFETEVAGRGVAFEWVTETGTDLSGRQHETQVLTPLSPRRVTPEDLSVPSNRTTSFDLPSAQISFYKDTSTVEWSVDEGDDAVGRSRQHPVGKAFFEGLDEVQWTAGTGGVFSGNDEENDFGGDAHASDYHTESYGPVGALDATDVCRVYTDSSGNRITRPMMVEAAKFAEIHRVRAHLRSLSSQGRVQRGTPAGGQFSAQRRGESDVHL